MTGLQFSIFNQRTQMIPCDRGKKTEAEKRKFTCDTDFWATPDLELRRWRLAIYSKLPTDRSLPSAETTIETLPFSRKPVLFLDLRRDALRPHVAHTGVANDKNNYAVFKALNPFFKTLHNCSASRIASLLPLARVSASWSLHVFSIIMLWILSTPIK